MDIKEELIGARDEYIKNIKSELMGPGSEFSFPDTAHELISTKPLARYYVGILFPKGNKIEQDNDETETVGEDTEYDEIDEEEKQEDNTKNKKETYSKHLETDETAEETLDEEINMSREYKPASMGLTFLVKGNADKIRLKVSFATYKKAKLKDCVVPYSSAHLSAYKAFPELADIMAYDDNAKVFRLLRKIQRNDISAIFKEDDNTENVSDEVKLVKACLYRLEEFLRTGYIRVPHSIDPAEIVFDNSDYSYSGENGALDGTHAKLSAVRKKISESKYSVTVMLVNDIEAQANSDNCLFQSKIEISSENNDFSFVDVNLESDFEDMDEEEKSLELLYRNKKIYATGLGVSADWKIDGNGKGKIWSEFFPAREIPSMSFSLPKNNMITNDELSMKYLSDLCETDREIKLDSMKKLVDLYVDWINGLNEDLSFLPAKYKETAQKNIANCKKAAERMYSGIKTLRENDNAYNAFSLLNRAMFMQRVHLQKQSEMSKENADRYPGDEEIYNWLENLNYREESDNNAKWRPFQIAFLLMDINSIVYDDSPERQIVDLIWFPTGGGKTEAYLGLTAFTIFYRRLDRLENSDGTAIIMRYTLRLLAAQQFTRAATLICAMEYIREDCDLGKKKNGRKNKSKYPSYPLGENKITIGLWIGSSHTPNKNTGKNSAKEHLDELQKDNKPYNIRHKKDKHNKFQVLKCPWCGTKLVKDNKNGKLEGSWGYKMGKGHFYMSCPQEGCNFENRLPIQIVDEELYLNPPTLLFATVDKFAMMPFEGNIGAFFGQTLKTMNNRAPELIIQDELHLISGALGTIVGLYETAIDALSSRKGVKPKIIASTATIRRAKEQCSALYNREVAQFPSPGLLAEDSFFAKEDVIDYSLKKYGRKYVGIMPSGRTKVMMEIKAMATLLQRAYMMNLDDSAKDKFWTLTVYFNSLKDLGRASTFINDNVKDFITRAGRRLFAHKRFVTSDELTSRVSTTELNETLDKLEKIEYSEENRAAKRYASDVLLATNMISVGIDVPRLNVMLMIGQPKLTSEYIQASSRIGRAYPGIAFIDFDSSKSRDRSHYEQFRAYHDSLYRFVEPTGVTPFSKPARERALHAVVATLMRYFENMAGDANAKDFSIETCEESIVNITNYIKDRVEAINQRANYGDDIAEINDEIEEFFDYWQDKVCATGDKGNLYFGKKFIEESSKVNENEKRLLKPYNQRSDDVAKETLMSMRNVDIQVEGEVIIWED